jgi:hypothetical protein
MKFILLILIFQLALSRVYSQDLQYARRIADTLSSGYFDGRGYVNEGSNRAAEYIARELSNFDIHSFGESYFQEFTFPMNIFPGNVKASLDGATMIPGRDFQVWSASPPVKGSFQIKTLKGNVFTSQKKLMRFSHRNHENTIIYVETKGVDKKKIQKGIDSLKFTNYLNAKGLIFAADQKLSWSVMMGYKQRAYPVIDIQQKIIKTRPRKISLDIDSRFVENNLVKNVCGFVRGSVQPDTFLVFTAHFDHLGRMGDQAYYPGANDNASGTAMVLDLARHYSLPENKPFYSMAFLFFTGEEAGLKGSGWFAEHPLLDQSKVKFLVNLDMVGTGSEGITVVNATKFKDAYNQMVKINADNEYIMTVKERGESCNSDHCPFYKKGVPSVFIYSMGNELKEYHNLDDIAQNLPFTEYKDIFRLVRDFMDQQRSE